MPNLDEELLIAISRFEAQQRDVQQGFLPTGEYPATLPEFLRKIDLKEPLSVFMARQWLQTLKA